jgi:hypothetical protein
LPDALRHSLPVDAGFILIGDIAVAHPALVRKRFAEGFRLRLQQFMGAAMTVCAIRSGGVAFLLLFAMDALLEFRGLPVMAGGALRLGQVGRMRKSFAALMTGIASQAGVSALGELTGLIFVAGIAIGRHERPARGEQQQKRDSNNARQGSGTRPVSKRLMTIPL